MSATQRWWDDAVGDGEEDEVLFSTGSFAGKRREKSSCGWRMITSGSRERDLGRYPILYFNLKILGYYLFRARSGDVVIYVPPAADLVLSLSVLSGSFKD